MGDAADMMLEGYLDDMGEYIDGKGPGYPRPRHFNNPGSKQSSNVMVGNIIKIRELVKACKIYKKWHHVAYEYRNIPSERRTLDSKSLQRLARGVCNEFPKFEEYCKSFKIKTDEQENKIDNNTNGDSSSNGVPDISTPEL